MTGRTFIRCLVFIGFGMLGVASCGAESNPITLQTALRLAGAQNRAVEISAERVVEARSGLDRERQGMFPWLSPGVGYRRHDGNLQDVVGNVFDASKQSGTAALTVQAQVELGDSIYRVLAAKQSVRAVEADEATQRRVTTVQAAAAYLELSRAAASLSAAEELVRISDEYLGQVRRAVEAGLAFAGDVQRAAIQRERNESLRLRTQEEVRVASVRLAQVLRLPMHVELRPDLNEFIPVALVSTNRTLDALMASALGHRSELAGAQARIAGAAASKDGTTVGPWIPTLGAQASLGGFAGGRNGEFRNADDFQDYFLGLSWRIGPGGIGDRTRTRGAESRLRIARLNAEQARDEVIREVIEARTRAESAAAQLAVASRALASSRELLQLTQARREFGVGVVLEAIDAQREFTRSQSEQIRAIADHNRIQWELWSAVGEPDPGIPKLGNPR